jgi:thiamine phosphate synthase YjbQ (UPF0047 family)
MRESIVSSTPEREVLVDITAQVKRVVAGSGIRNGLVSLYAQGATAAVMIQETHRACKGAVEGAALKHEQLYP